MELCVGQSDTDVGPGEELVGLKAAVGSEGQQLEAVRELASWQLDGKLS